MTNLPRFSVTLTEKQYETIKEMKKKRHFSRKAYSEIIRYFIIRGLKAEGVIK